MCAWDAVPVAVGEAAITPFDPLQNTKWVWQYFPGRDYRCGGLKAGKARRDRKADSRRFREEPAGEMGESALGQRSNQLNDAPA
jgi:hypothetical protein